MPDGVVSPRDFVQMMDQEGTKHDMSLSVTHGNTVIFDSYTPEHEVRKRNLRNNNVSKLNQMPNRFSAKFGVEVRSASVTAVLCANTVADYRVVDKKSGKVIESSDKRPDYMKTPQEVSNKRQRIGAVDVQSIPDIRPQFFNFHHHHPPPQFMGISNSAFDHPGIPVFMSGCYPPPPAAIQMPYVPPEVVVDACHCLSNFTSRAMLNPRQLDDVAVDQPFPFSARDPTVEQPDPIFDESALNPSAVSDNIRAVVPIKDLLLGTMNRDDETFDAAATLQEISSGVATTTTTTTKKKTTPPQ